MQNLKMRKNSCTFKSRNIFFFMTICSCLKMIITTVVFTLYLHKKSLVMVSFNFMAGFTSVLKIEKQTKQIILKLISPKH